MVSNTWVWLCITEHALHYASLMFRANLHWGIGQERAGKQRELPSSSTNVDSAPRAPAAPHPPHTQEHTPRALAAPHARSLHPVPQLHHTPHCYTDHKNVIVESV